MKKFELNQSGNRNYRHPFYASAFALALTGAMAVSGLSCAEKDSQIFAAETAELGPYEDAVDSTADTAEAGPYEDAEAGTGDAAEADAGDTETTVDSQYEGLVSDALNDTFTTVYSGTHFDCTYAIPQINVDSIEVDELNQQIYSKYYDLYSRVGRDSTDSLGCQNISYHWGVADNKLSLTITADLYPYESGWSEPEVFTIDLAGGSSMTQDQLMEYFGFTEDSYYSIVKDALGNKFGSIFPDRIPTLNMSNDFNYGQYLKTISDENVKACILYMTEEGHPGIYAEIYSLAAGDYYPYLIDLATYANSPWYAQQGGTTAHYEGSTEDKNVFRGKSFNSDYDYEAATAASGSTSTSGSTSSSGTAASSASGNTSESGNTSGSGSSSGSASSSSASQTQSLGTYTVRVSSGYLALRTAMAFDSSNEIGSLYTGETVEVIEKTSADYWYVYSPKTGTCGYVNCNYLVSGGTSTSIPSGVSMGSRSGGTSSGSASGSGSSSGTTTSSTKSLGTYTVRVSSGYLALRNAMAFDYSNEIGSLYTGETVEVIEKTSADYWYVYSPKTGTCGYVNCNYLVSGGTSTSIPAGVSMGNKSGGSSSGSSSTYSGYSGSSSSGSSSSSSTFDPGRCGKVIN